MYRKNKIKINVFYDDDGVNILEVLKLDFKEYFENYLRKNIL